MLAQKTKLSVVLLLVGVVWMTNAIASGQQIQPPSQRYQPTQAHEQNKTHRAQPRSQKHQYQTQYQSQFQRTAESQMRQQQFRDPNAMPNQPGFEPGTIQQTSYTVRDEQAPNVPEILRGRQQAQPQLQQQQQQQAVQQPPRFQQQPTFKPLSLQSAPVDVAPKMDNIRQVQPPQVDPNALSDHQRQVEERLQRIRSRMTSNVKPEDVMPEVPAMESMSQYDVRAMDQFMTELEMAADSAAEQQRYEAELAEAEARRLAEVAAAREAAEIQSQRIAEEAAAKLAAERQAMDAKLAEERAANEELRRRFEEMKRAEEELAMASAPVQEESTQMTLQAEPMAAEAANDVEMLDPSNAIRQVSSAEPASEPANLKPTPEIALGAPAIKLQTFGPTSIGINKTATYKVIVQNLGDVDAERVLVGINMPEWVDLQNTNLTNGMKEITNGVDQARLVWTIDRVPAQSSQTITVEAVPRKAEVFDLAVEWTFIPRVGATSIEVTEPRLEMKISGPRDVRYGEKAIYHVTVRNPGTGVAENVHVKLPEALGGERQALGSIEAGGEKDFQIELLARTAGQLDLIATASADGELKTSANREIAVRRAELNVNIQGPQMKYAGSTGQYVIQVSNQGDSTANEVVAALALPVGVKYVAGVDGVKEIDGGIRWPVGSMDPGDKRTFRVTCELNASGDLQLEAGVRGQGELAASNAYITKVETIADLVLSVEDPKGPLPTGQNVEYTIRVKNRGTRSARDVKLVMQFSEGVEPSDAKGLKHRLVPGQVLFSPIVQVDPGQEMTFKVVAQAFNEGTKRFRAQLTCADSDSREIAEGTTRFFGEQVQNSTPPRTETPNTASNELDYQPEPASANDFQR